MSSLEDEIFFGSRQLALDSYLKAREELNNDSGVPPRRGVNYPNVLDEISYQKSFERQDREGERSGYASFQPASVIVHSRQQSVLSSSCYLSVADIRVKEPSLKEGACIEVLCQLGELVMSELCFFSQSTPISIEDYLIVNPVQESLSSYFKRLKASCLKLEVIAKDHSYESRLGSSFVPIQTVASLVEELDRSKQRTRQKRLDLKLHSQRKTSRTESASLSLTIVLSKDIPQSTKPQTFRVMEQQVEKQKMQVTIHDVEINIPHRLLEVTHESTRQQLIKGGLFVLQLLRTNTTLNSGLQLTVLADGKPVGTVSVSVLHVFLSQSVRGRYPIVKCNTLEHMGFVQLELSEPLVISSNQALAATSKSHSKPSKKQQLLLGATTVSVFEIIIISDSDLTADRFYLIGHHNKQIGTSHEFRFRRTAKSRVYVSDSPMQFHYTPDGRAQLMIELYRKGQQYDQIMAYSKLELGWTGAAGAWWEDLEADCSTHSSTDIAKIALRITNLSYPHGFFVEDKVDRLLQLFSTSTRRAIQVQLQQPDHDELRQLVKKQTGLTFVEVGKLEQLIIKSDPQSSLGQALRVKQNKLQQVSINPQELSKQLQYIDSSCTGYVSEGELIKILGYFPHHSIAYSQYLKTPSKLIVDGVFAGRAFTQSMVSYPSLLRNLQQPEAEKPVLPVQQAIPCETSPNPVEQSSIRFIVLRAANLNTLHPQIPSPNSYITELQTAQSTQVCHRNCNPEYLCELGIEQPKSEQITLRVMHKDFRSADALLGTALLNITQLRQANDRIIRLPLGKSAYLEVQRR